MSGLIARYEALVAAGELKPDADQRTAAEALARLQAQLEQEPDSGLFARLLGRRREAPRGIYLWGGVGRGKSMLMDLLCQSLQVPLHRVGSWRQAVGRRALSRLPGFLGATRKQGQDFAARLAAMPGLRVLGDRPGEQGAWPVLVLVFDRARDAEAVLSAQKAETAT